MWSRIGLGRTVPGHVREEQLDLQSGLEPRAEDPEGLPDVRELQRIAKQRGIKLQTEANESTDDPASFTLVDPDGNPFLVDRHVPKPKR